MKQFIGVCYIGVDRGKTAYVILRFAKDVTSGVSFIYGPVVKVSKDKMELSLVVDYMENRPELNPMTMPLAQKIPNSELLQLKNTHSLVNVTLLKIGNDSREVKIMPLHAKHGWKFDSKTEEIQYYSLPMSNEGFVRALDEALKAAT